MIITGNSLDVMRGLLPNTLGGYIADPPYYATLAEGNEKKKKYKEGVTDYEL